MKKSIKRGIASLFVSVSCLVGFLNVLALENAGQINVFLGTLPPKQNVDENTNYYPSAYDTVEEMRVDEELNDIETQQEGSVLFYNNNDALPLKQQARITLFGKASADPIYRGASGGSGQTDVISLKDALENNGIAINQTVFDALKNSEITRSRGNIGEVPVSFYNTQLQNSYSNDYNDAAVVVLSRFGGEQQDLTAGGDSNKDNVTNENGDPIDNEGVPMLSLHKQERELLQMIENSGKFKKTIVILNSGYPMDVGELEGLGVDSLLWCGFPGRWGFQGVADIISGKASPSGRTVDTYATDSLSSPAMRNYGGFTWTNVDKDGQNKYLIYAEGIYLGYKYYETRYQDEVLGINNATSSKGSYASNGGWSYADEMVFTFGSGISYMDFDQELLSLNWDKEKHQVTAEVKVTSLGVGENSLYTGKCKDVVELYVQLPYESGQAQKSAIQLIGYGKTKALAEGEEDIVTITVDDYLFATYDNNATNGADTTKKGCYVFDEGDYYFSIGDNAHDALNNVLTKRGVDKLFDEKGETVIGDESKVVSDHLDELDNVTHAKSSTGEIVSNQFDEMDINHFIDGAVTYLNRDDWNTYPIRYENLTATDEMKEILDGHWYNKDDYDISISEFKHSQEVTKKFIEMKDVPYEDTETWDAFIDQLTPTQLAKLAGEKFGNNAIPSVGSPANSAADGPDGIQANTGYPHVCETIATSTFNDELIAKRGFFMAEDGIWANQHGVYGFGCNMHRTPYGGRNFEYYSEDMTLSYLAGAVQVKAAQEKGLITYIKHFCANDQEVWRNGNATLMTEQAFRQGPLKGFEGAFVKGGSLGTMTSNARCGLEVTSMSKAVMTQVLRNEWGFKGLAMTDSSKGSVYYLYTKESLAAGTDQFNNDETRGDELKTYLISDKDGFMWKRAREIAKHYFYTYVHSFAINGLSVDTVITDFVPWWETAMYVADGAIGLCTITSIVLCFVSIKRKKERLDNEQN